MICTIRNMLVIGVTILMCRSLNSVAQETSVSAGNQSIAEVKAVSNYKVSPSLMNGRGDIYYLVKEGSNWTVAKTGDMTQSGVEKVFVNAQFKTIFLAASPPKTVSDAEKQRGPGKDNIWECYSGLMSGKKRDANGYVVCASDFTKNVTTTGQALVGSLNLLLGTARSMVAVDQDKLLAAAQSSGLIDQAELEFAERERLITVAENARLAADSAAEQGDAQAKYERGLTYLKGTGIQRDPATAEKWFIKASNAGSGDASFKLGEINKNRGNSVEAKRLWSLAVQQGSAPAQVALTNLDLETARLQEKAVHDAEQRQRNIATVKEIGQAVCRQFSGTIEQYGGQRPVIFKIKGFTEGTNDSKIQIRIGGIQTYSEQGYFLNDTDRVNGDVVYQNGAIIWGYATDWTSC